MARLRALTPIGNFQPRNDPIRMLAEASEAHIGAALKGAMEHLRELVPVKEIAAALAHGNTKAAVDLVNFKRYEHVLKTPIGHIARVYEIAAHHGGQQIAAKLKTDRRPRLRYRVRKDRAPVQAIVDEAIGGPADAGFAFDRFDANTQARLRQIVDSLIGDLTDSAKSTINSVVLDGVRAGDSFTDIAENIRDTISLTPNQAQAVASYRRALENLDPNALQRALRDSNFDGTVQDAIDSGEFLSDSTISDAVDAYLDNYLDYRANTISRTESLRASNAGLRESYLQADEQDVIPSEAVTRQWLLSTDESPPPCPICASVVENNPDGVALDEDFQSDDGTVGDPPLHPNCRCTVQYVTNLDLIPDPES